MFVTQQGERLRRSTCTFAFENQLNAILSLRGCEAFLPVGCPALLYCLPDNVFFGKASGTSWTDILLDNGLYEHFTAEELVRQTSAEYL